MDHKNNTESVYEFVRWGDFPSLLSDVSWGRIGAALDGKNWYFVTLFYSGGFGFSGSSQIFVFFFSLLPSDVLKWFGLA
jgi:hypothetical protein